MAPETEIAYSPWLYRARVEGVVDGDTLDLTFDPGFEMTYTDRVRLAGVDTREIHFAEKTSEEYERGIVHMEYVQNWVRDHRDHSETGWPFLVRTEQDDRGVYGRYIADVRPRQTDGRWLTEALLDEFDDVSEVT